VPSFKKIQLFGQGIEAISPTITSQRRVNLYFDFRVDGENNPIVLIQTPGLTRYITLPQSPIRGLWQNGLYAFAVAGNGLYLITDQGFTFLDTFGSPSATGPVKMTNDIDTLALVDGSNVYTMSLNNLNAAIDAQGSIVTGLFVVNQILATAGMSV
jgi:hypothetical protein